VRDRRAEYGDDGVADELLDRPAESLKLVSSMFVVDAQQCAHVFRVACLGSRGRPHEVDEHDADDLPLFSGASLGDRQRRPALRAELRGLRVLEPAGRAAEHRTSLRPVGCVNSVLGLQILIAP